MAAGPTETLGEYLRAFETLDPERFASFYNVPCIFITPAGATAATDAAAVQALADKLVTGARQYGFTRTEVVGAPECQMLSDTLAALSGVFRRFDSSDRLVLEMGSTYVMQRADERWKIVALMAYAPRASQ